MEKLIVVKGQLEGREFDLRAPSMTIGRDEKREITLPESLVSRQHATVEKRADGWYLTDSGSANGTNVNGGRITSHKLVNGDRIEIGNFVLQFVAATEGAVIGDSDRTVMLGDDMPAAPPPPPAFAPPAPPPPAPAPPAPAPPPPAFAAPPPPAFAVPPPAPPPPAPPAPKADRPAVKVDSTIYISDDLPQVDFASYAAAPAKGAPAGKAAGPAGKPKSNLGLIIGIAALVIFLVMGGVCLLGFLAYSKGWGPFGSGGAAGYDQPLDPSTMPSDPAPPPEGASSP